MEAIGQAPAIPPGHRVPEGFEPDSPEVVTAWLIELGADYGTEENANLLAAQGVESLYDTLFTRADLVEWGFTVLKARRIKEAADALRHSLGLAPVEEAVPVQAEVQVQRVVQDRGEKPTLKPVPTATGSNRSGVADMAGRVSVAVWVASLVVYTSQVISNQASQVVRSIRLRPTQDLVELQALISDGDDKKLGAAIVGALSDKMQVFITAGVIMRGSGVEMLRTMLAPIFNRSKEATALLYKQWNSFPQCRARAKLYEWLQALGELAEELAIQGEVVSSAMKQAAVREGISTPALKDVAAAVELASSVKEDITDEEVFAIVRRKALQYSNEATSHDAAR